MVTAILVLALVTSPLTWQRAKKETVNYLKNPDCIQALYQGGYIAPPDHLGYPMAFSEDFRKRIGIREDAPLPEPDQLAYVSARYPNVIWVSPNFTEVAKLPDTLKYRIWILIHEYVHTLQVLQWHESKEWGNDKPFSFDGNQLQAIANIVADACNDVRFE